MTKDSGLAITELKVDGGASRNNLLMQFQSDILQARVVRPTVTETTARGAAYLAGLAVGFWKNTDEIAHQWKADRCFAPSMPQTDADAAIAGWRDAIRRTITPLK